MKTKEYIPNTLFDNVLTAIRKELQDAITGVMKEITRAYGPAIEVESTTLWDVMFEAAYLPVIVKKDVEFTYLRKERVVGAMLPHVSKEKISIFTESGAGFHLDELGTDDLSSVYAFLDEVRQRLDGGEFVSDCGAVMAVYAETNRLPAAAHAA